MANLACQRRQPACRVATVRLPVRLEGMATTLIHQRVESARRGENPFVIARLASGWAVIGDQQFLRGYSLLLPDPVVRDLNALDPPARRAYLDDMVTLGDALLLATGAGRINYEILGNLEPALHAHVIPRYPSSEPPEMRHRPAFFYDWNAAPRFDPAKDRELLEAIRTELRRLGAG